MPGMSQFIKKERLPRRIGGPCRKCAWLWYGPVAGVFLSCTVPLSNGQDADLIGPKTFDTISQIAARKRAIGEMRMRATNMS